MLCLLLECRIRPWCIHTHTNTFLPEVLHQSQIFTPTIMDSDMHQLKETYQLSLFPHLLLESEFHGCLRLVFSLQNFMCISPQSDFASRKIVVDYHIS